MPKQFILRVLNATLDLAALVLVGVAAFLGSAVVLAPLAPIMWGWVLVGVAAFLGSEMVLAPFGSLHVGLGVGWCSCLLWALKWSSFWLPSRGGVRWCKVFGVYAGAFYFLRGGREYQCVGGLQVSLVNCNAFFFRRTPLCADN